MMSLRSELSGFVLPAVLTVLGLTMVIADRCCRPALPPERVEWTAMGTVAAVQWRGDAEERDALREPVVRAFDAVTREFNAHDPSSRVCRVALRDAAWLRAYAATNAPFGTCYEAAFLLSDWSGGAFDVRWRGPDTLDFGAIAKGFAVDLAAGELALRPGPDALVDLGGNLKSVRGTWRTGVKDPAGEGFAATVTLRPGEALATSAEYYRGRHVTDARTGRPVTNGVSSVTVLAPSAMWADGLSTVLFILGPAEGRALLDAHAASLGDVAVLWLLADGRRVACDPRGRFDRAVAEGPGR